VVYCLGSRGGMSRRPGQGVDRMRVATRCQTITAVAAVVLFFSAGLAGAQSPGGAFVNFESGHVRPLALSPNGARLFALNTPDNRLAIYDVGAGGLTLAAEVPVGLEPVAVAARTDTEVWVVNHLSDSISIVTVNAATPALSRVIRTLHTCDEPRDIVFANARAFVTTARRGQNCPSVANPITEGIGRALVQVWNPASLGAAVGGTPLTNVVLFGDAPRALATNGTTVWAAVFHSGNRTTAITEQAVSSGSTPPMPPPPAGSTPGAPPTALIVKRNASGQWVDEIGQNWSASVSFDLPDFDVFQINATANPPVQVGGSSQTVGVGTVLFNMAVRPSNGRVYVTNTEARNEVRFEPRIAGDPLGRGVQGNIAQSRVTVVNGTTPTARHLNPHINYTCTPPCVPPAGEAEASLAFPTDIVFSSNGARAYVAGFGSEKVGIFDATALEAGTITNGVTKHLVEVGAGPSGLALDEARNRLYVMNRIDHTISIVDDADDPAQAFESDIVSLRFDPSPAVVKDGRIFLYDARRTSGHGDSACASCHVFGDLDSLAWDLGDPFGAVEDNENPFRLTPGNGASGGGPGVGIPCTNCEFHPMKGPMTTQTLRGMAGAGPMHWRGDRTGTSTGGSALDEDLAFKAFNPAFVGLLGRASELTPAEMQAFTDFILTVVLPPNPVKALTNADSTSEAAGRNFFNNNATDGGALTCVFCHRLPFGSDGLSTFEGEPQEFKIAHMRNLYQKVGMFGVAGGTNLGDQVRGFGFLHDGSVDTVFTFVSAGVFQNLNNTLRRNLEAFSLAFDTGLAPAVGQQISVSATTVADTNVIARIDLLRARADAGECDLVVKAVIGGEARGALYVGGDQFQRDRHSDPLLTSAALRALAGTAGQEQTYTCVPPATGGRIGLDRDLDGTWDRRELDCGTDPADPLSEPPTLTGACGGATTTSTSSSTSSTSTSNTTPTSSTSSSTSSTSTSNTTPTSSTSTSSSSTTTTLASTTSTSAPPSTSSTSTSTSTTFTTSTTAPDVTVTVQSTSLKVADRTGPPAIPEARRFTFKSNTRSDPPAHRVVVPARGTVSDPTPGGATGGGAILWVYNSGNHTEGTGMPLAASGWTALGTAVVPNGYVWKAPSDTAGIQRVKIKADLIAVKGGGTFFAYTLDEPSQGRMAMRLQLGDGTPWCADSPAKLTGNPPSTASTDRVDRFQGAPKTPAPAVCPPLP
jgi:DNA-binding beta-propeller fold protein YncE